MNQRTTKNSSLSSARFSNFTAIKIFLYILLHNYDSWEGKITYINQSECFHSQVQSFPTIWRGKDPRIVIYKVTCDQANFSAQTIRSAKNWPDRSLFIKWPLKDEWQYIYITTEKTRKSQTISIHQVAVSLVFYNITILALDP